MKPILSFPSTLALARHLGVPQATVYSRLRALLKHGEPVTLESISRRRVREPYVGPGAMPVTLADGRQVPSIRHAAREIGVTWRTAKRMLALGLPVAPREEVASLAQVVRERSEVPYETVVSRLRRGVPLEQALLRRTPGPARAPRAMLVGWTPGQKRARRVMCAWARRYHPEAA